MTIEQMDLYRMSAEIMVKTMATDTLLDELVKLGGMLKSWDFSDDNFLRCEIAIDAVKAEIKSRVKES